MTEAAVTVSPRGAARLRGGHPWVYRSDVTDPAGAPGIVRVQDPHGRMLGRALWSPASEIRVRLLTPVDEPIDEAWWTHRLAAALRRRAQLSPTATAYRVVHAEGDGLPSLVVDRYGDYVVAQLLTAGIESVRDDVLRAIDGVLAPRGILLRHDAAVRRHEHLPLVVEDAAGHVPDTVLVQEGDVGYLARPRGGQKTGAFLDQRENRALLGTLAHGRTLDLCCYHGLFALHMARRADQVIGVDQSQDALDVAEQSRALAGAANLTWREGNVFDILREWDTAGERFDTIVLDPPAFAKGRASVPAALRGYKELNRRALRLLAPGGRLFTASCSFHVGRALFRKMLAAAAADAGRIVIWEAERGQAADHPERLTVPETGYLKGALLRVEEDESG